MPSRLPIAFVLLTAAAAVGDPLILPPAAPATLPFTVAKDTTVLTAPLNADGTVDYVGALNQRLGAGVTADQNAWVAFVQTFGPRVLEGQPDAVWRMTGAPPLGQPDPPYELYLAYLRRHGATEAAGEAADDRAISEAAHLWQQQDDPVFATYLLEQKTTLDHLVAAANRPRWWIPLLPRDGRSLASADFLSLSLLRDGLTMLSARATLRAAAHDFPGFLADISACLRFCHFLNGPTVIDCLVAIPLEEQADKAIAAVAAAGDLTAAQIAEVQTLLQSTAPLPSLHDPIHAYERWCVLDSAALIAIGRTSLFGKSDPVATLDPDNLDWNALLRQINADFDTQLHALALPTLDQRRAAFAAWAAPLEAASTSIGDHWAAHPHELRADYTARIAPALRERLVAGESTADELERRASITHQLTAVIVAAAGYKAREGHWPASLHALVPKDLAALPQNPWYPDQPAEYTLAKTGPIVSMSAARGSIQLGASP